MIKKATFLYKDKSGCLWYEYKNHTYIVNPLLWTSTAQQHRQEQSNIDIEIQKSKAHEKYLNSHPKRYEDTADYGLELFFKSIE